jgi:hypothetical protein
MSQVFPKSNLPASSQPWGRAIQDKLENLEKQTALQGVNLSSGDAQIQASYKRLDETVTEIQKLSEPNSKYSVDVSNLTGEVYKSSGIDIQIANPADRKQYPGRLVTKIYSEGNGFASQSGFKNIDGDLVGFGEFITRYGLKIENQPTYFSSGGSPIPAEPVKISPTVILSSYGGGGTTGASIDNGGQVIRTTSSERYKQDIEPLTVNYNDLLSLEPKRFKFKKEADEDENARYYAGFIAEEIAKTSLTDFVAYTTDDDGNKIPDGVYYAELSAALLTAIKHQDQLINSLTDRIKALEDKV